MTSSIEAVAIGVIPHMRVIVHRGAIFKRRSGTRDIRLYATVLRFPPHPMFLPAWLSADSREQRGTQAAEQSDLASNPLCPPRVAEPRREEVAENKAMEPRMQGRLRGEFSVLPAPPGGQGEEGRVSPPQLAIKNLFRGERLHTIRLAKRERRKEGILSLLLLLVLLFFDKDEEKPFKLLVAASVRDGG